MWNLEPSVLRSEGNGCLWTLKPIRESTLLTDLNFELQQYTLFLNLFFVVWKDPASLFLILLCNKMKFAFNFYLIVQECESMCTFWPRNCKQKTKFNSEVIYMPIYCGVFPLPSQTHSSSGMPQSRVRVAWWPLTANTMLCQWLSARRILLKLRRSLPIEPW